MSTIEKYPNLKPFPKGVSGNPSGLPGRPMGSRTAFSQGFLKDLAEVWHAHGDCFPDERLFVREKIDQRLFGVRQRVGGIRIGGRRGGRVRTGCRGRAIGLLARRRRVGLARGRVGAGRIWHSLGLTLSLRLG